MHATPAELSAVVEPDLRTQRTVLLDLAGVSFADASGVACLLELRRRGAVLMACSGLLAEMLRTDVRSTVGEPPSAGVLVERLRAGDAAAFAELVAANAGALLSTARRLLRNEDDACDTVREAFLSAFTGMASFDGRSRLSTWLYRIVVGVALSRLRRRRDSAEPPIDELLPRFDAAGAWAEVPHRWTIGANELLERGASGALVRECVERLPDASRIVLLMRDVEELDTDETAQLLGVASNTVKTRLHRARQALRTLIAQAETAQRHTV